MQTKYGLCKAATSGKKHIHKTFNCYSVTFYIFCNILFDAITASMFLRNSGKVRSNRVRLLSFPALDLTSGKHNEYFVKIGSP